MVWVVRGGRIGLLVVSAILLLSFSFALDPDPPRVQAQDDPPTSVVTDEHVASSEPAAAVTHADGDDPLEQPMPSLRCSVSAVGFLYGMVCEEAAPVVLFDLPEIFR